jgi:4-amino-4-deoxy-L-arabinose transferase-like glycosyltransferase
MSSTEASAPPFLSVKKESVVFSFLIAELFCLLVLVSPWDSARALVAPWYLLILPGSALLLLLEREVKGLIEFVLKSFLVSVLITFVAKTAVWYLKIDLQAFDWAIAVWIPACLLVAVMRDRASPNGGGSLRFSRAELAAVLLSAGAFAAISAVVLNLPYTPAPDELHYMFDARSLNLFSSYVPYSLMSHASSVNFVDSRPLWSTTISSFLAVSSTSAFSSRVIELFFLSMTMLAVFMLSTILASERAGLVAACLALATPVLVLFGSTVLLDLAFAAFSFLGFCFFIRSVRTESGERWGISATPLAFVALSFLFAYLTKPGDLTVFVAVYIGLCYAVWRSRFRRRRLTLAAMAGLPSAYLAADLVYNFSAHVFQSSGIHNALSSVLPYSFFGRFFSLDQATSAFQSISSVSPLSLAQGMYVALLSPYLITYAIVFLFLAGVVLSWRKGQGIVRFNLTLVLSILLFSGFISALLLYPSEIPRDGLFVYPFMVCLAAIGLYNSLKGRAGVWVAACALILAAVSDLESTLLNSHGIPVGNLDPNQLSSSVLTVGLGLGLGLVAWKALQGSRIGRRIEASPRLSRPFRYAPAVAVGLILIVSLSQAAMLAQASPVLSQSSFSPFQRWLNTGVSAGSVIITNGNLTLMSLANDSLLQLIHTGGVKILTFPATGAELNPTEYNSSLFSSYQYLVVFKNSEYTFTDSYYARNFSLVAQSVPQVVSSPLVDVYEGIGLILLIPA